MVTITAELEDGLAVDVTSGGGHAWRADEPEQRGGSDTGPTPYELLLSSLAACTCITVAMYARRKGWPLEGVRAECAHDRVHAEDCADCDDERRGYIDRITAHITIDGPLEEAQRQRLAEIAARCPVYKTLEKGVHVVDEVDFSAG